MLALSAMSGTHKVSYGQLLSVSSIYIQLLKFSSSVFSPYKITMDFSDKVVLITGASSGLGAATAIHFSKLSASLVLIGRKENNLRRIALYCEKAKGIKPLCIIADVTIESEVERIVDEATNYFGKIDVLVNNAGISGSITGIKDTTLETFDEVISTNIRAVFHLTKLATPYLIHTKGCVVNVSCTASTKPSPQTLSYNISKAALDHFTKCVALELAPDGVRVNAVNPGFVKTNLLKDEGLSEDQVEMLLKNVAGNMPLKKPIEAGEVAALIAFLASDQAKSVTGCCYPVDGGTLLR